MILLPHLLVGAAIGAKVHNFAAVFILNIVLHFVADTLPHWEYFSGEITDIKLKKQWLTFLSRVALDFGLGLIVIFYFFWQSPAWPYVAVGALSAVLPDFLVFVYRLFPKTEILKKYYNFHHRVHREKNPANKASDELSLSLFCEGLVVLAALCVIVFR